MFTDVDVILITGVNTQFLGSESMLNDNLIKKN